MAGPGRPPGLPKTGGRQKGALDKQQRQLVSAELAHSILATFEMLGGTAAMVEWAFDNKTIFYTQILSRLMPAPQKEDPDFVQNNQFNVNNLSEMEAARRVAFMLAKAVNSDPSLAPIDITQEAAPREPEPPLLQPEPVPDPDREQWAQELKLSPEERRDAALVRETREASIESYAGSGAEQGHDPVSRAMALSKRSAGELTRSLSRSRRRDLL